MSMHQPVDSMAVESFGPVKTHTGEYMDVKDVRIEDTRNPDAWIEMTASKDVGTEVVR